MKRARCPICPRPQRLSQVSTGVPWPALGVRAVHLFLPVAVSSVTGDLLHAGNG